MLDSKSFNIFLLEDIISSKTECVFIHDLSDLTLQIIFDAWWASINVGLQRPVDRNNSSHASSWQFCLHCGIQEPGSCGIRYVICHQVLSHPLDPGTSWMGKHLLVQAHIAKLNQSMGWKVTDLTSSTVGETVLPIWKTQQGWWITVLSSQRKFIFDIQVWSIMTALLDKMLQTGSWGHWKFWNSPRRVELLPYITICFSSYSMENHIKS